MMKYIIPNNFKLTNVVQILLMMVVFSISAFSQKHYRPENEFHHQALLFLNNNKIEEAQKLLKYSANEFSYAPSYFELAKIEYKDNTIPGRTKARKYLQKAIWNDPKNIEYLLLMAELMEYFSKDMAYDVYEHIIEIDAGCTEAVYNLARISEEEFYEFYKSVRQDESSPALSLNGFAYDDFIRAEKYFKYAIDLEPDRSDSYLHLAYLYREAGYLDEGIQLINKAVQLDPGDKIALQFLGYLYYKTARFDSCMIAFAKLLELMNQKELENFKTNTALFFLNEEYITQNQIDSLLQKFWDARDPLYLTDYNERLLEHYARVIYSNIKFSVEEQNVEGWKSDRGEILIRYGEPRERVRFRPYINAGGRTALMLKTDLWIYDNKEFAFTDDYWTGDYKFSAPNYSGRHFSQYQYDTHTYAEYLRRTAPEDFEPVYKGPAFTLPYNITQFKDIDNVSNKSTQIFVNYAVDISGRFEFRNRYKLKHKCGLFFLDKNANMINETRNEFTYLENNQKLEIGRNEKYWINSLTLDVLPDTGTIAFELIRDKDDAVSSNHFEYRIKEFNNDNLALSDIVIAARLSTSSDGIGSITRRDIQLLPNPTQTFTKNDDVFIYYEAYNLEQDSEDKTNFEQRITVKKIEETTVIDDIFSAVSGLFGSLNKDEIILNTNYQSFERNTQVYLQLDMSNYMTGDYRLTVSVVDKKSGAEASEETIIYWRN